ncbi:hypothetical protein [Chenggangzhangella methanolivorans]|uniref:Uncharacterized protein n=1 Tax=Chenggangzhangella methanolivorans TaxID=1437009 RepID=A0A9E6R818_9HYPH|nr:hypothetical protein [Chenggangzhangella methanolivorans]QZN98347.1 hypothetical protein K6K41_14610 [Chenggangzhangella methanolivorans]
MTRIVRVEEIDGQLVLRVPEDVAKQLKLSAGDDVNLTVEAIEDDVRRQLEIGREIIKRNHAVLAALAK